MWESENQDESPLMTTDNFHGIDRLGSNPKFIWAGHAGLAMGHRLAEISIDYVVLQGNPSRPAWPAFPSNPVVTGLPRRLGRASRVLGALTATGGLRKWNLWYKLSVVNGAV